MVEPQSQRNGKSRVSRKLAERFRFPKTDKEVLACLAEDPNHGESLLVLYQHHSGPLRNASNLLSGFDRESRKRMRIHILLGVARRAREFDPSKMNAADWIRNCMNSEARQLRQRISDHIGERAAIN